jgi:hypothetical protein
MNSPLGSSSLTTTFAITNLEQEKEKFFANQKYNPQFTYANNFSDEDIYRHGQLKTELVSMARMIIQQAMGDLGSAEKIALLEGETLPLSKIKQEIKKYLEKNEVTNRVQTRYSSKFTARTAVNINREQQCILKIRLPESYGAQALKPVLNHEIGTHIFRWLNEFEQPWSKNRVDYGLQNHLEAEEGLATWHTRLHHPLPYLWQPALYVYIISMAQEHPFCEVFSQLEALVPNPDERWFYSVRAKRGLHDTSRPGGSTKDQVYLAGAAKVANWLVKHQFEVEKLYLGKLALEDVERMSKIPGVVKPRLPLFIKDKGYAERMYEIIRYSGVINL